MTDNDATPIPPEPPVAPPPPPPPATPEPARPAQDAAPAPVPPVVVPAPVPPVVAATPAPAQAPHTSSGGVATAIIIAVVLSLIVATFAGVAAGYLGAQFASQGIGGLAPAKSVKVRVVPPTTEEPVVAAAAAAVPAVVNIDVRSGADASGGTGGLPNDHPSVPMMGNGSGVAYKNADGGGTYIITNNHVVENAKTLTVRDSSGRSAPAELVGRDPETDVAVLKVDRELPVIDVGDSADLIVGQTVVAIGSPYGLEHSVTSGVVSALGRSLPDFAGAPKDAYPLIDVIQTDAAINPGNSGGALVDRGGKLVGINTAIYSDSGSSGGIGFAVPANTATRVADQLIEGGDITHPFVGIVGQTITEELAADKKLTATEGAYVVEVTSGSGADKAGVKTGDVVTAVDGQAVRTMDDLILQVRRQQVGDIVKLTLLRDGETVDLEVTVGDKPQDLTAPRGQESSATTETEKKE